ncbi:hypothetical protein CPLU01_05737 [Colletotrichum plurivorum]|uniref:Uncharacterized protein n=1 Tax=Colletotrichum plurivorum TaxID=2175906 RepID=A0A8H6KL08_9PEZI|nr:hypothetical protein CPLU01_05737 [Colletotrichum plurivorum]
MWDAVYWHHSNKHRGSGSLEDRLPLEEKLKYLVWVGTRTPIGCEWCIDDQHRSTVHHLTRLVSDEHAEEHETNAKALHRKRKADEELSGCGEKKKLIDYDFSTIELGWRGSDPCHLCEQLVKKNADFLLVYHHWMERHGGNVNEKIMGDDLDAWHEFTGEFSVSCVRT